MKVLVLGVGIDSVARIKNKLKGIFNDVEAKILTEDDKSLHPDLIAVSEIVEFLARGEYDILLLEDSDGAKKCLAEIREWKFHNLLTVIVGH